MREAVTSSCSASSVPGVPTTRGRRGLEGRQGGQKGVTPYSEEFIDCLAEVAQYVYDTYGKFPNTFTTMVLPGYVQAVHLDTDFYDTHYQPGAYLETHAEHMERWHADGSDA